MSPQHFDEQTVILSEDDDEYIALPVHLNREDGRVTSCWQLTDEELETVIKNKQIWLQILTFGMPLQPQLMSVEKPDYLCQKQS